MPREDIAGIVLAAGRSARMGRPKPLLELDGGTFVTRCVGALRSGGCDTVVVVTRADAPGVAAEAREAGAGVVANADEGSQQVESLRLGLGALPADAGAAVVLPVDHPLVRPDTVRALVARWRGSPDRIVRPVHGGRPGHPTLFPRSVWPSLTADLPRGARSIVEGGAHATDDLAVDDPGVVADVDTPEAYARWVEGR